MQAENKQAPLLLTSSNRPIALFPRPRGQRRSGGCRVGQIEPDSFFASLLVWSLSRCWRTEEENNPD